MKKCFKVIGIILGVIVILGIVFFVVDYNRVQKQEKPIFCIQNPAGMINDGGTIEYFGLGYKVIDFHTLVGFDDIPEIEDEENDIPEIEEDDSIAIEEDDSITIEDEEDVPEIEEEIEEPIEESTEQPIKQVPKPTPKKEEPFGDGWDDDW